MSTDRKLTAKIKIDGLQDLKYAVEGFLNKVEPIYKSCLNCEFFDEKNEMCKFYKARPPARVIAFGCPTWSDYDEIPF